MPSARPPTRSPTGSRRGDDTRPRRRSAPQPMRPHPCSARVRRITARPHRHPATAPATTARRRRQFPRGWWPRLSRSPRPRGSPRPNPRRCRRRAHSCRTPIAATALQGRGHRVADALAGLLSDSQHRCHRIRYRSRVGDRGQLENPYPVDEFVGQLRGDIQREPGLTNSTDADQRHQPMRTHRGLDLGDLGIAAYQVRDRRTQVAGIRGDSPQWRKLRSAVPMREVETP